MSLFVNKDLEIVNYSQNWWHGTECMGFYITFSGFMWKLKRKTSKILGKSYA